MSNSLVNIVSSQREEYQALNDAKYLEVKRNIEYELKELSQSKLIKVVLGPRRAGKSTLIRRTLKDMPHAYFSFEDERLPQKIDTDKLIAALKITYGNPNIYYFDEIQNLQNWEKFLHRFQGTNKNIFVTGSNSKLLSKELSSTLTGRHHAMTLLPFSWAEVKTISEESFLNYLQEGGFPDLVMKNASTQSYLTQLYDSILMRDIVQRYKVRNIFALRSLCDLLIRSVGSHVTGRSLQKSLPVELNNSTIENYIRYLEEAFLVVLLQKFEPSLAKQKKADRKPYVYDTGFIRAINPSQITDNLGQLLETYVFLTLIRLGAAPNVDLFYYQNPKSEEVDFIWFKKGKKPILIQSCWTLAESSTRQREFRALLSASKKFKTDELLIVSINERKSYKEENQTIKVIKAENLETEFS